MSGRVVRAISATKRWSKDRPFLLDLAIAGLIAAFALVDAAATDAGPDGRDVDLLGYGLILAGSVSLIWRRRAPMTVLVVVTTMMTTFWLRDHQPFLAVLGLPALYAVAAHAANRRRAWVVLSVAGSILLAVAGSTVLDAADGFHYLNAISMTAYLLGATAVGVVIRNRDRIFVDTQRRAETAEANRLAEAERAVASERARIAREMHDVVAHGMSVISVQAAAAREVVHTDPDKAAEVLGRIEDVGRQSLSEMRRMLGVLRSGPDVDVSLAPQPTLSDLGDAVAQSNQSGVDTELVVIGQKSELSAGVELAAFRIVQEALTNVLKHADGSASALVSIDYQPTKVAVSITDDGAGATSALSRSGSGNGLIGMRERVEIYDGEFSAGPRVGGGWAVLATFPIDVRPRVKPVTPLSTGPSR